MRRPPKLDFDRHVEMGKKLSESWDNAIDLLSEVTFAYGGSSKASKSAFQAVRTGVKEHHFCRFRCQQSSLFLEAGHTS